MTVPFVQGLRDSKKPKPVFQSVRIYVEEIEAWKFCKSIVKIECMIVCLSFFVLLVVVVVANTGFAGQDI